MDRTTKTKGTTGKGGENHQHSMGGEPPAQQDHKNQRVHRREEGGPYNGGGLLP